MGELEWQFHQHQQVNLEYKRAPYEAPAFKFAVQIPPAVRNWPRKRRIRWRRQQARSMERMNEKFMRGVSERITKRIEQAFFQRFTAIEK